MPRIISWTPDNRSTATNSDAHPVGGDQKSASIIAANPPTPPNTLSANPVSVLIRNGMT